MFPFEENADLIIHKAQKEKNQLIKTLKTEKMKKILALSVVLLAFSAGAFAQLSDVATATATIVTPLSIDNTVNMNFGNVAVGGSAGTVVLTPAGVRSTTGGCALPTVTGTVTAATFNIAGQSGTVYTITMPAGATTITSGSNTMTVDNWQSSLVPTAFRTLPVGGTEALNIGATLNVAANQPTGTYISGTPFTVSINYN